jgi:hypothetical protein
MSTAVSCVSRSESIKQIAMTDSPCAASRWAEFQLGACPYLFSPESMTAGNAAKFPVFIRPCHWNSFLWITRLGLLLKLYFHVLEDFSIRNLILKVSLLVESYFSNADKFYVYFQRAF